MRHEIWNYLEQVSHHLLNSSDPLYHVPYGVMLIHYRYDGSNPIFNNNDYYRLHTFVSDNLDASQRSTFIDNHGSQTKG